MKRLDPAALRARMQARPLPKLERPQLPPLPEVRLDPGRRQEMMAAQQASAARLRERLQARVTGSGKPEERKRRPWWLLVVLLLLLLAIVCCIGPCEPEVVPEPEPEGTGEVEAVAPEPVVPPFQGRVAPVPRPAFPEVKPEPVPWLASFRMQVAARSTRLSECFVGTTRPGVLRWTALVEPETGRVTDHELEPVLKSEQLTGRQRDCVLRVLEEPAYRIDGEGASRVGMVIEF